MLTRRRVCTQPGGQDTTRANQTAIHRYGYGLSELQRMHVKTWPRLRCGSGCRFIWPKHSTQVTGSVEAPSQGWQRAAGGDRCPADHAIRQRRDSRVRARYQRAGSAAAASVGGQKHLLERTLDTEPGTVYIFDLLEQRNLYINRHWLDAYGYTAEETQAMGGELLSRIFHQDDLPSIAANHAAWRQAVDGEMRSIEYRVRDKTGGWHWLMSRETRSHGMRGKVSQILGIAHDVTERKMGNCCSTDRTGCWRWSRPAPSCSRHPLSELVLMVESSQACWVPYCCSTKTASISTTAPLPACRGSTSRRSTEKRSAPRRILRHCSLHGETVSRRISPPIRCGRSTGRQRCRMDCREPAGRRCRSSMRSSRYLAPLRCITLNRSARGAPPAAGRYRHPHCGDRDHPAPCRRCGWGGESFPPDYQASKKVLDER